VLVVDPIVDRGDRHGRLTFGLIAGRQEVGRSSAL